MYRLNLLADIVLLDKSITTVDRDLLDGKGKWEVGEDVGEESHPWSTNQVVKSHPPHQQHRVAIKEGLAAFRQGAGMRKRKEPSERENASSTRIDSPELLGQSRKLVTELIV